MKPDTRTAMKQLIVQVREAIPFGLPEAEVCLDGCEGCSKKLLEYLEMELDHWEQKIAAGAVPDFGDLNSLARNSRKIHAVLQRNGLVEE